MKIILLNNIKGLGGKFEVKEVKNGYAKNFLISRNLAKAATGTNLKILAREKAAWEVQEKKLIEQFQKIANQFKDIVLDFPLKTGLPAGQAGEKVPIFGSVSALEIKKALENLGHKNFEVLLEKPIKELGERLVEIDLGKKIKASIKIRVHSQP